MLALVLGWSCSVRCSALLLVGLASACAAPEDETYFDPTAAKQDNASGSRWRLPAEVARLGDGHDITYTGAGAWTGQTCDDGISPGAAALTDYLLDAYPQILSIGGFACRHIVGRPDKASVHSTGRALDIMLPVGFRAEANNLEGDPIGNFLVANADALGIQFVIWDRTSWGGHRKAGNKERYYSGSHPHNDHIHVELSEAGGRGEAAWLEPGWTPIEPEGTSEPVPPEPPPEEPDPIPELPEEPDEDPPEEEPPSVPPQGEQLPEAPKPEGACPAIGPDGGVIDSEACIWLRGPSNYWQHESDGYDGALAWTRAVQSGVHQSFAEWSIFVQASGNYALEVYAHPEFATHEHARYVLEHGASSTPIELDLRRARSEGPWLRLGTFALEARTEQVLTLYDNSDAPASSDARIVVDAVRLVPEGEEPPSDPGSGENPGTGEEPEVPGEDPSEESEPDGLITNGCTSGGSRGTWLSMMALGALFLRRRKRSRRLDL